MLYYDIELCFVPYFSAESRKMYILKVYIYFSCINTQQQATSPFKDTPVISPPQSKHLRTGLYQGSDDSCEGDRDSYINCQA